MTDYCHLFEDCYQCPRHRKCGALRAWFLVGCLVMVGLVMLI